MQTPVDTREAPQGEAPPRALTPEPIHAQTGRGARGTAVSAADSHQQLFLSVLLLLIAFFALLVSRSEVEVERAEQVLRSIEGTFNPSFRLPSVLGHTEINAGSDMQATTAERRADLRRSLALSLASQTVDAEAFRVFLEPEALFEEPRAILRKDRLLMLGRLAQSLADRSFGSAARATLLLEGPRDGIRSSDRRNALVRLEILRGKMLDLGAPDAALAFGLRDAPRYRWVFEIDTAGSSR